MNRIYPAFFPEIQNEPTKDRFEIVPVGGKGVGLSTKVAHENGSIVFAFQGIMRTQQSLFTLQILPELYIEDHWVMGRVLHSCDPNCDVDMNTFTFRANRRIGPGELITMDYEATEDYLYNVFSCGCGSPRCRGEIKGRLARLFNDKYARA